MAETITKGFIINRIDSETFDEIITFISETGNRFTVLAKGVKKILSKNARSLFFGCLVEVEFFATRKIEGIGKLKRIHLVEPNDLNLNLNKSLMLLNALAYKGKLDGNRFYKFYVDTLNLIKQDINQNSLNVYILIKICSFFGIKIFLDHCAYCSSKKIKDFSIEDYGFVCPRHYTDGLSVLKNTIKILYLANNKMFSELEGFSESDKVIAAKIINSYLNEYSGINFINNLIVL